MEEVHQASRVLSWGTVPLELLRIPFAIIREIPAWYHPDETDSFLNLLAVGVTFCMELAMAIMLCWVKCALSDRMETMNSAFNSSSSACLLSSASLLYLQPPSPTCILCFVSSPPVPLSSTQPKPEFCFSRRAFCLKDTCLDVEIALAFLFVSAFIASFFTSFLPLFSRI